MESNIVWASPPTLRKRQLSSIVLEEYIQGREQALVGVVLRRVELPRQTPALERDAVFASASALLMREDRRPRESVINFVLPGSSSSEDSYNSISSEHSSELEELM